MRNYIEKIDTVTAPVIALRGMCVFPSLPMSLELERDISKNAAEAAAESDMVVFLVMQRDPSEEAPSADGLFEVVVVKAQNAAMLLPAIVASLLGREGEFLERSDIAQVFKAREVRVTADPPLTIQFDGEPTGITTPFSARVLPGAVNLIVTEQEYERAQG